MKIKIFLIPIFFIICGYGCAELAPVKKPSRKEIIKNLNSKEKIEEHLVADFIYLNGPQRLDKSFYMQQCDSLQSIGARTEFLQMTEYDSKIVTKEKVISRFDSIIGISKPLIMHKTYSFKDAKIKSITVNRIENLNENERDYLQKKTSFLFFVKDQYNITDEATIFKNIKTYLDQYATLSPKEKYIYGIKAGIQGTYISENIMHSKIEFKGANTVIVTHWWGNSPTSYEIDGNYIKIIEQIGDILLRFVNPDKLICEKDTDCFFHKINP
jgi:hypothetical protein